MLDFNLCFSENINIDDYKDKAFNAFDKILNKNGVGSENLGWVTIPETYDREEYERMKEISEKVKKSEVLVVIGVGGSFLGANAVIDAMNSYCNEGNVKIIFVGNNLSGDYLNDISNYIKDKDFYINVISKSGSTFETAVAFRILKKICEDKYGAESKDRIIVITDENDSLLRDYAVKKDYETYFIPSDIGGRFSLFTPAGLFPIMCSGVDTDSLLLGANDALEEFSVRSLDNLAIKYAIIRNYLFENGKNIELLISNEPKLHNLQEWWKQLFSESEGKDGKGLYTFSAIFTRDLHSFGQMIQDGKKIIFETIIEFNSLKNDILIAESEMDYDNLDYLSGQSLNKINGLAVKATIDAHISGGVPVVKISVPRLDTYNLGKLIYFFEMSCAISAYMLNVNPFNQPGVENYKKNMYELLKIL